MKLYNIKTTDRVVIYENKGVLFSGRLYWMFRVFGHKNVSILNGGFKKWVDAGFATETTEEAKEADYNYTFEPELYKNLDQVKEMISHIGD